MYDSNLPEAYAAMGLSYFIWGKFDEASASSRKAIELDPDDFIAYWTLGRIHFSSGELEQSLRQIVASPRHGRSLSDSLRLPFCLLPFAFFILPYLLATKGRTLHDLMNQTAKAMVLWPDSGNDPVDLRLVGRRRCSARCAPWCMC